MDEQQELSHKVVNNLELQETMMVEILPRIGQQVPVFFCGAEGSGSHDVTVCLIPNGMVSVGRREYHGEILTAVKVHSSRLSRCSKYFETCMTERWRKPKATFLLETQTDLACYTDCFSRMYSPPLLKDFKDIEYNLKLLRVASQIQFHELMDSILLYISSKHWTDLEELMIREYSTSPDFPRDHAQDLVVRLGIDQSDEDRHQQFCDTLTKLIRSALGHDGNFHANRTLFHEILPDGGLSNGVDSDLMKDVIAIASREAKEMLVRVADECDGQTFLSVPGFAEKILAIRWILETLLVAKAAEEVAQCFVHLHALPKILLIARPRTHVMQNGYRVPHDPYAERAKEQRDARNAAEEVAKVVVHMYREVATGNLLLKTPERVALIENWHLLLETLFTKDVFDQATKELFSTLPLSAQMELVKLRKDCNHEDFISTQSLAKRLRREWPVVEVECDASAALSNPQLEVAIVSDSDT